MSDEQGQGGRKYASDSQDIVNFLPDPKEHPMNDPKFYIPALFILGALAMVALIGILLLAFFGPEGKIPESIVAIGSAATGALAGLFTRNHRG